MPAPSRATDSKQNQKNSTRSAEATRQNGEASPALNAQHSLFTLHHSIGNRAFGQVLQAKLAISSPGDVYEQEADQIADRVMRASRRETKPVENAPDSSNIIHQASDACGNEKQTIQRKALPANGGISPQIPAHVQHAISSGGELLDQETRSFFEPRIGYDLSSVRIFTDSTAGRSARSINARAYTFGNNLVFGSGEYRPESENGRHLLAHELAHAVQHGRGGPPIISREVNFTLPPLTMNTRIEDGKTVVSLDGIDVLTAEATDTADPKLGVGLKQTGDSTYAFGVAHTGNMRALLIPGSLEKLKAKGYNIALTEVFIERPLGERLEGGVRIPPSSPPPKPKSKQPAPSVPPKQATAALPTPGTTLGPPVEVPVAPAKTSAPLPRTAKELIDDSTSFLLNLDEEKLGLDLLKYAQAGNYLTVDSTLEELWLTDRDDVSYELTKAASDDDLKKMAQTEEGRKLLDRLYDELTSGHASEEEVGEANRILMAKAQRIDPQKFIEADEKAMIIPYSTPGFTKFSSAPLTVRRLSNGKLWVRSHMKPEHFGDAKRLINNDIWITGTEIDPDMVVGLYLYDEGGKIIYMPALYLLQLGNADDTKVLTMAGEAAFTGFTLGLGGEAVAVGEAANASRAAIWGTRALNVLKWTDRAAGILMAASTLINDHRGWIIREFGADGQAFLQDWGKVDRVLAIYGMARGAIALGQLGFALKGSFQNWRAAAQAKKLNAEERAIVDEIIQNTEKSIKEIEDAQQQATAAAKQGTSQATENAGVVDDTTAAAKQSAPATPQQTGTGAAQAEGEGAQVIDLATERQKLQMQQKARQPVQQVKKTGTDDVVPQAAAQDVTQAANDNAEVVQGTSSTTSSSGTSASGKTATVTPLPTAASPKPNLSEFVNGADLQKNNWIGKPTKVGDPLPEGYHWKDGRISRNPLKREANYAPLDVQDGKLTIGEAAERISNPSTMNRNYKASVTQELKTKNPSWSETRLKAEVEAVTSKNAVHHLVPDNIVQRQPLAKAAREAGYDLDRSSNLKGLPKDPADIGAGDIGHWTSHPQYDRIVTGELDAAEASLRKEFGSLDNVPKQRLLDEMKKVEDKMRKLIEDGKAPMKDGRLAEVNLEESDVTYA